jgi:hypothetical protein
LAVANAQPGPLYAIFGTNAAYYSEGPFMGDWFGPGRYAKIMESLRGGDTLYAALHALGAQYFLVTRHDSVSILLPNDPEFESHFELVFADSATELYRLHDSDRGQDYKPVNFLRNPGFEKIDDGLPVAWAHYGNLIIGRPQGGAASGDFAVKVTETNGLSQSVRITPGNTYELHLQARADQAGPPFRLQVNWINREGGICEVFIRVHEATLIWEDYSSQVTAPPCAEIADVYASGQSGEPVWMDSFVFTRGASKDSAR